MRLKKIPFIYISAFVSVFFVMSATSSPVLKRTSTPHPKKQSKCISFNTRFPLPSRIAKPLETMAVVEKEKTEPSSDSEIQHVKALVCLKCILEFDEFKNFYNHKCADTSLVNVNKYQSESLSSESNKRMR